MGFSVANNCVEEEQSSLPVRHGDTPNPSAGLTWEGVPKWVLPSPLAGGRGHLRFLRRVVYQSSPSRCVCPRMPCPVLTCTLTSAGEEIQPSERREGESAVPEQDGREKKK